MSLFAASRKNRTARTAESLYQAVVRQGRQPGFYLDLQVPDTVDGRFDMIALHTALLLRRLKRDAPDSDSLAQALFDRMFDDMDANLREMGVGDVGVSHRIKGMAQAFYGRLRAYDDGLSAPGDAPLITALRRNLFRKVDVAPHCLQKMAGYLRQAWRDMETMQASELQGGGVRFPPPPSAEAAP